MPCWRQQEKKAAEDEMVRKHHQFNGHDFEQTLEDSRGQRTLVGYSSWCHKESDTTEWTITTNAFLVLSFISCVLIIQISSLFLENSLITSWGFVFAVSSVWPVCASPYTFMIYSFTAFNFCTSWEKLSLIVLKNRLFYSSLYLLTWLVITLIGIAHLFTNPLTWGQEHLWVRTQGKKTSSFCVILYLQQLYIYIYIYICHIRGTK